MMHPEHSTKRIVLHPHSPEWAGMFQREADRLQAVTDGRLTGIEHIGSTSIPGLVAKPVIDLMPGVRHLDDVALCVNDWTALGYRYVPGFEATLPERRFLYRQEEGRHTHHVHLVVEGSPFWKRHLGFRDALRADPVLAHAYGVLKEQLAREFEHDIDAYTSGKTSFIETVLKKHSIDR